jgi:Mlc titration factor MtfA (ptsG expression regulator)
VDANAFPAAWPAAALLLMLAGFAGLTLAQPWWTRRRHLRLRGRPFPSAWARMLERRVPLAARLPRELRERWVGLIQVFIADKPFIGCGGQVIDDEVRVTIAAQACLLLLGRPDEACYPRLRQVLVYPDAFVVQRTQTLQGGVVDVQRQALAGESWGQGQVVLAWSEVLSGAADEADGINVVLHEFAHQIDQDSGTADGRPWLAGPAARQRWGEVMTLAMTHARESPSALFDGHAVTEPAEFFAVATENFFERPLALAEEAPGVYAQLCRLYGLHPHSW